MIGDVCGKGAEAAAVTALARYTMRASATLHSDRPQVVLQDLNDAIRREGGPHSRFCTVLYIALSPRPGGVKACVATGGHPLPLLMRADGSVETAGRPGTLLGILPDPEIYSTEVELAPGDTLVLYTDGVTEVSPLDDRFGPEILARVRRRLRGPRGSGDRAPDRGAGARDRRRLGSRRRRGRRPARLPRRRGAVCRRRAGGSRFAVKLLVLTPEPIDADAAALDPRRGGRGRRGAGGLAGLERVEGRVLGLGLRRGDRARPRTAQEETVERLEEEGVDAAGDTGESEPAVAIQDALATFPADRIVIFSHPEGDRDYREDEGLADAEARFGVPSRTRSSRTLHDSEENRHMQGIVQFGRRQSRLADIWE